MTNRSRAIGEEFAESEAQTEATNRAEEERVAELRRAAIRAHEIYNFGHYGDDLEVSNFDDEDSFVEKVDGGFWVEARVWVSGDEVEGFEN